MLFFVHLDFKTARGFFLASVKRSNWQNPIYFLHFGFYCPSNICLSSYVYSVLTQSRIC